MPLDFPASPTNGQTYTSAGITWTYNSTYTTWDVSSAGPVGIQGFTGSRGFTGSAGFTGSQGIIGFTGSQGVGFTGSQGVGFTGSASTVIGFTGSQGPIGFTGSQGSIGFTGSQGVIGFTGSQGVIGFTGSQGPIGFTGSRGFTGSVGFTGSLGGTGFTGSGYGTGASVQMGSLGVGTAASGVSGEIRAIDNITAYYSSDRRFKENIEPIADAISKVISIGGKTFNWSDEYISAHGGADGYFITKGDFGVIAQDVELVFPLAVRIRPDNTLAVDYEKLSALAFQAIKEQQELINKLIARVDVLENNN